ncbi:hypothetical protein [Paracoccus salipaludis]|uniref:hypothetical protein n=1 Tax=Paracoccus salipaludis TaxID=2032623 RepID=UPI001071FAF7|nr:hypothetical protein [Paracoccus salipaludis]
MAARILGSHLVPDAQARVRGTVIQDPQALRQSRSAFHAQDHDPALDLQEHRGRQPGRPIPGIFMKGNHARPVDHAAHSLGFRPSLQGFLEKS